MDLITKCVRGLLLRQVGHDDIGSYAMFIVKVGSEGIQRGLGACYQ